MSSSELDPPRPPQPVRLSRGPLLAVAVLAAVTLLVVVFYVARKPAAAPAPGAARLVPGGPDFLQRPPAPLPSPGPPPTGEDAYLRALLARERDAAQAPNPEQRLQHDAAAEGLPSETGGDLRSRPAAAPPANPRREAFVRALHAPLEAVHAPQPPASSSPPDPAEILRALRQAPAAAQPLGEAGAPFQTPAAPAAEARTAPAESEIAFHPRPGRPTVPAGTLLPAVLLTTIDSDLPGDLLGQVTRDVYDAQLQRVLIPRGTKLLGSYHNQVAVGQRRLLVAWGKLLFPDGSSLDLPGLPGIGGAGQAGLGGSVDNHTARVFGKAFLLSLIAAGAQLSQPQQVGLAVVPSQRQVAAAAVGQELSSVATEILRRDLSVPPTIHVPAGTVFEVFLRRDLTLPVVR